MSPLLDVGGGKVRTVATHYAVTERLGVGRFSEVYRAFDSISQTDVALKVYTQFDEGAHRLAGEEYKTLATLQKLNADRFPRCRGTVRVRFNNRNHPILVLELGEYVGSDGDKCVISLQDVLPEPKGEKRPSPLPDAEFWGIEHIYRWILDMAGAVKMMHSQYIIHRDLKPANILLKRPPGAANATPFFLDFNSSPRSGMETVQSGTRRYLPPEVTAGTRAEPSEADDLWAIALVAWELLHGIEASPQANSPLHSWLCGEASPRVLDLLRKALAIHPKDRFPNATEFVAALEACIAPRVTGGAPAISTEEFAIGRRAMGRLRSLVNEALAGEGDLPVPKEIADQVSILFSWLTEEDTHTLDLVSELIHLGPKVIPVGLEHGYKLKPETEAYRDVLEALKRLAREDPDLAVKAIAAYALSSNVGVRAMCRALCRTLEVFPATLLESLIEDEGVLLPHERLDLAELCIFFCKEENAMFALTKYMCRVYILDYNQYFDLRTHIASRLGSLNFPNRALLIVQDTAQHIWEDLADFDCVPEEKKPDLETGLLQLMADAFASMGDDGYQLLMNGKVPRESGGRRPLKIFRVFARKLAEQHRGTHEWLLAEREKYPDDRDLEYALALLEPTARFHSIDQLRGVLERYLQGGTIGDRNVLRFTQNRAIFEMIQERLSQAPSSSEVRLILSLLRGFDGRHRPKVVQCTLQYWDVLAPVDRGSSVEIMTAPDIYDTQLREQVIQFLSDQMKIPGQGGDIVRRGLERLLR